MVGYGGHWDSVERFNTLNGLLTASPPPPLHVCFFCLSLRHTQTQVGVQYGTVAVLESFDFFPPFPLTGCETKKMLKRREREEESGRCYFESRGSPFGDTEKK